MPSVAERMAGIWLVEYIDLVCSPASAVILGDLGDKEDDWRPVSMCFLLSLRSSVDGLMD